ncbi:hypothetical protein ACJX0J_011099, partial [Zea mays]
IHFDIMPKANAINLDFSDLETYLKFLDLLYESIICAFVANFKYNPPKPIARIHSSLVHGYLFHQQLVAANNNLLGYAIFTDLEVIWLVYCQYDMLGALYFVSVVVSVFFSFPNVPLNCPYYTRNIVKIVNKKSPQKLMYHRQSSVFVKLFIVVDACAITC